MNLCSYAVAMRTPQARHKHLAVVARSRNVMVKSQSGDQAAYAIRIDRCRRISPGINDRRRNSGISTRNDACQHLGREGEMTSGTSYTACAGLFCRFSGLLIRYVSKTDTDL